MPEKNTRLHPFDGRHGAGPEVACRVGRCGGSAALAYSLHGDLSKISIPPPADIAVRRDRLWETTCLECFIADSASEAYWEFNFSPAGHWNAYHFTAYRRGMREEASFSSMPVRIDRHGWVLHLSCRIDLTAVGLQDRSVQMGLSAVILTSDGQQCHWALAHPGPRPDFHHREAFALTLAP